VSWQKDENWTPEEIRRAERHLLDVPYGTLFDARLEVTLMIGGRRSLPEGPVDNVKIAYEWQRYGDHAGMWAATRAMAVIQCLTGNYDEEPVVVTWDHASDQRLKWIEGLAIANLPSVL
jgi:hypothetical protein